MKCKFCGVQTNRASVCGSCRTIIYHIRRLAQPQDRLQTKHNDNNWAIAEVARQYEGGSIDDE